MMSNRLSKSSPFRPPDWRYQRTRIYLAAGECPLEAQEDVETVNLHKFLEALRNCDKGRDTWKLKNSQPDHWTAFDLFADCGGGMRNILEARLLADEDIESISEKVGISKAAVELYAALFFDVRDRLNRTDFIHVQVLGNEAGGPEKPGRGGLLKWLAYTAGPAALNHMLRTSERTVGEAENDPVDEMNHLIEALLLEKTLATVQRLDVNSDRLAQVLTQAFVNQQTARAESGDSSTAYKSFLGNVDACLKQIPWSMAKKTDPPGDAAGLPPKVELRADDQMRLANGLPIDKEKYLRGTRSSETDQPGDNGRSDG